MIFNELRNIQRQFGYLPADQLKTLAKKIDVPLYHLHGVASFYPHFHLTPPPKADVRVCQDMSCHLRGAREFGAGLDEACRQAGHAEAKVSGVSCLGRCNEAPAVAINEHIYTGLSQNQITAIVGDVLMGRALPEIAQSHRRADCASDPYGESDQYQAVQRLVQSRDWTGAFETLKSSGLRGLGGAGFPTESKWQLVRQAASSEKFIVCNADESEPGTFKDRFILTHLPHLVIEGMIFAGVLTGAEHGIIYIRHEYEEQEKILHDEIRRCQHNGLLGPRVLGSEFAFNLEVFVSPGGYICGEETALLEAIEGKRAEPRNKPPFPVQQGLWNKPTVINNVETFANVPIILFHGVDWYKSQGVNGAAGLKFIGVSGDVAHPGVYEVPMGTPVADLIFKFGGGIKDGRKLKAFAPSGPSSGFLPASMADVHLDFKSLADAGSMLGSGALVVCADDRCMLDMALNATQFFRNESCGKCVPCRVGSQKLVEMLTGWTEGTGSSADLELIDELSATLRQTSICGLGQVVPAPIASVLKHFRGEVEAHILHHACPSEVCPCDKHRSDASWNRTRPA
ncbi:MAG: NADH-ubiquinone oxidoreductase-F iron-sulfur binding region domain-containing protein [Candidatus Acidiferrales bacterium]